MNYYLNLKTPLEYSKELGVKSKKLRLHYKLKQVTLAEKSGVSVSSIKRFEGTGQISLLSLLKIANVLNCLDGFSDLFPEENPLSIAELEKFEKNKNRQRGRK